jgi:hypothetical protein
MTIFDLLFIVLFLSSIVTLIFAAVSAIRGRRAKALSTLRRFAACLGIYVATVLVVAIATPRKTLNIGDVRCFDDWCVAVASADRVPTPEGVTCNVTLRLSSRARRVGQRAIGTYVYLTDDRGRRFDPSPDPTATPMDVLLGPGESVEAKRTFLLPNDARDVGAVVEHGGSYCFPGCFIVGDTSIVGKHTIVRLP